MDNIIPFKLMRWANESWVSQFLVEHGITLTGFLKADPNQRISKLGSRLLHLAAMSPDRPSKDATKAVMEFLLAQQKADPNIADDYGRTPLTLFVTQAAHTWRTDEKYGTDILSLLFEHGADANLYFTPDFVHLAGCKKWTLGHHLNDPFHGRSKLPVAMMDILGNYIDWTLLDSEGRSPHEAT